MKSSGAQVHRRETSDRVHVGLEIVVTYYEIGSHGRSTVLSGANKLAAGLGFHSQEVRSPDCSDGNVAALEGIHQGTGRDIDGFDVARLQSPFAKAGLGGIVGRGVRRDQILPPLQGRDGIGKDGGRLIALCDDPVRPQVIDQDQHGLHVEAAGSKQGGRTAHQADIPRLGCHGRDLLSARREARHVAWLEADLGPPVLVVGDLQRDTVNRDLIADVDRRLRRRRRRRSQHTCQKHSYRK